MRFKGASPLYIQIADYYENLISLGVYKEGDMLPSVREVALAENLNPNTVARAFSTLVDKGVIESIQKKGYFVLESQKEEASKAIIAVKSLLNEGFTLTELEEALKSIKEQNHDKD